MLTPADPTAVPTERIYAALLKIAQHNNITVISDDLSDAQFKELATPSLFLIIRDETGKSPALRKLTVIRPTLALGDRNNSLARNLAFYRLLQASDDSENIQKFLCRHPRQFVQAPLAQIPTHYIVAYRPSFYFTSTKLPD
jgi:hypothetical protein